MESKSIFLSVTFWGILASVISTACKKYGIVIDEAGLANDGVTLVAAGLALYGRFRATQPVHILPAVKFMAKRAVVCAALLAGCSTLGLEQAQTFDDRLAYGYSTHAGLAVTLHDLDFAGKVNATDYANAYHALDLSGTMLSEAKFAQASGDMASATAKLDAVNSILLGLATILEQRKGDK